MRHNNKHSEKTGVQVLVTVPKVRTNSGDLGVGTRII